MPMERNYRISGHETFPCRYTWLPKAVRGLSKNPQLFLDEDQAMVDLGVGKNMVRAIRYWAQAAGVVEPLIKGKTHHLSLFGEILLGEDGLDPFLEDIRTLWLIHWNLSTDIENPLLAWDYLLNQWHEPEFVPGAVLKALHKEANRYNDNLSLVTVKQHFDTFLHTYIPTRGRKREVQEDNLDCPLVELELIVEVGERELDRLSGQREPIYAFRKDEKPDVSLALFAYSLYDFWQKRHKTEATLPLREVTYGHGSPGQVFKLSEDEVRTRVEALRQQTEGFITYTESASLQQLQRHGERNSIELLKEIYSGEEGHG
ncbi:MAG: DUF4007 family protein [Deltaproteobacteria bacterium]|nr:DUF4007 family protein [Deltaproteobacteria bacterium]